MATCRAGKVSLTRFSHPSPFANQTRQIDFVDLVGKTKRERLRIRRDVRSEKGNEVRQGVLAGSVLCIDPDRSIP